MRRKHKKKKCAVALIAILSLGSISVGAKVLLHSAGVIDNNRKEVMQSQIARKIDEDEVYTFDYKSGLQTDLIDPENLYEKDVPIAKNIVYGRSSRNFGSWLYIEWGITGTASCKPKLL